MFLFTNITLNLCHYIIKDSHITQVAEPPPVGSEHWNEFPVSALQGFYPLVNCCKSGGEVFFRARVKTGGSFHLGVLRPNKQEASKDVVHLLVSLDADVKAAISYYRTFLEDAEKIPDLNHILRWYRLPPSSVLAGSICEVLDHHKQVKTYGFHGITSKDCSGCGIGLQTRKIIYSCRVCHKADRAGRGALSSTEAFCSLCAPDIRARNASLLQVRDSILSALT